MQERGQKSMQTKKPVGLMGKLDLIKRKKFTTTLRDKVMEGLLRGQHTVELPLDPTYLHFWITNHNTTIMMKLRKLLSNMPWNITH